MDLLMKLVKIQDEIVNYPQNGCKQMAKKQRQKDVAGKT